MFQENKDHLFNKLANNSIAILGSGNFKTRSNDTEYLPFRPNSNFYYLTGFNEAQSFFIAIKKDNQCQTLIYLPVKDKLKEIWTGKRLGVEAAPEKLKIDQAKDQLRFEDDLNELLIGVENIYFDLTDTYYTNLFCRKLSEITNSRGNKKNIPSNFIHLPKIINKQRLTKSTFEISEIKKACEITKLAHVKAMTASSTLTNERELLALIESTFTHHGATGSAYSSIVAGGDNALCLHYIENNQRLNSNELILIDAGAEYNYYASDVTRTFPIGKKFTSEQKIIYQIVLEAQREAINYAKSGVTLTDIHNKACSILLEGLIEYSIFKGSKDELLEKNTLKTVYPHGTSHFMGLDVHDQNPRYENEEEICLNDGMIFTVEPGLYLFNDLDIPSKFKGIGVRIEDNILIENGVGFNLTKDIPKSIEEIEKLKR